MIIIQPEDRVFTYWQMLHACGRKRCKRCAEAAEMCEPPKPYSRELAGNYERSLAFYNENRLKKAT